MRITEDYLCTHVNEFIHEEQTTLKHLLVEKYTTLCLCSNNEQHRDKVWCQSWPWSIANGHNRSINERVYHIVVLTWNQEVITIFDNLYTESTEGIKYQSQVRNRHVFNTNTITYHRCNTNERAYLNHIRQDSMVSSMQFLHTLNSNQVAGNTANLRSHCIKHLTELLDIRLTSCVVYRGCSFCQNSCHDNISSTRNRGFI